jgi:hypothetical protein
MKVASINSSIQEDVPKSTRNIMISDAKHASMVWKVFIHSSKKKENSNDDVRR